MRALEASQSLSDFRKTGKSIEFAGAFEIMRKRTKPFAIGPAQHFLQPRQIFTARSQIAVNHFLKPFEHINAHRIVAATVANTSAKALAIAGRTSSANYFNRVTAPRPEFAKSKLS
jgi:hypothetical protein